MRERSQGWCQRWGLLILQAVWFFGAGIIAAIGLVFLHRHNLADISKVFPALRGSIFTGFFTLGGFLLTLKNIILTYVRQGVYERKAYKKLHANSDRRSESLYASLRRLGTLIHYSILGSLVTSFAQLTVGLVDSWVAGVVCLSLAAGTSTLLVSCLLRLRENLVIWFDQLDEDWDGEKAQFESSTTGGSR